MMLAKVHLGNTSYHKWFIKVLYVLHAFKIIYQKSFQNYNNGYQGMTDDGGGIVVLAGSLTYGYIW